MQIHRIHGRDLREALERAGRLHGTDAVVLGHEQVSGGVTVAVTDRRPAPAAGADSKAEVVRRPGPVPGPKPVRGPAPGLSDVERALARTGTSPGLIAVVIEQIERSTARGAFALDRAAQILGERVAVAPSPKVARGGDSPCVLAFIGAHGSGVTTTITKLAGRLVKKRRRVALVDLRAEGAPRRGLSLRRQSRELEKYGRLLQVPVDSVRGASELRAVLERSRGFDAVLVDGSGVAGRDVSTLRELRTYDPRLRLETYLTLKATAYRGELDAQAADHAAAELSGLVLTHLDATRAPAPALEHALDTGRPLAFLCDGADVSRHLHRPSGDLIADLFLRGRIS